MGAQPEIQEIREREQANDDNTAGGGGSGGGILDGAGGLGDLFSLSRRQLLLIAVVVVAILAWYVHRNSTSSDPQEEVENLKDGPDLDDVTVAEDEDQENVEIRVPANPDDELEKDAAIIDYFKESGHMSGGDGD